MTDSAQVILFVVIIILTILLVVLAIQIFFILKELKKTVDKTNKILDDTGIITESVSRPISNLSSMATGIKAGAAFAKFFKKKKPQDKNE